MKVSQPDNSAQLVAPMLNRLGALGHGSLVDAATIAELSGDVLSATSVADHLGLRGAALLSPSAAAAMIRARGLPGNNSPLVPLGGLKPLVSNLAVKVARQLTSQGLQSLVDAGDISIAANNGLDAAKIADHLGLRPRQLVTRQHAAILIRERGLPGE